MTILQSYRDPVLAIPKIDGNILVSAKQTVWVVVIEISYGEPCARCSERK